MPGGRPRTPTRVLQIRGTHRRDRHGDPQKEIAFALLEELPPPPGFLDDVGAFEWTRTGRQLVADRVLADVHLSSFTAYCLAVGRLVAAERALRTDGMLIETPSGYKQQHPAVAISRLAGAEVRKFAREFGLTPSSQPQLRQPAKEAEAQASGWDKIAEGS